ncbi:MAG TPA: hypothetical protein VLM89_17615 [Phycisphaerae bacterium]|nr:hypothetical protein [Phycisphaerae bacterium]
MPVTLICPNLKCRTILQVPDIVRGKKVRCGRCGRTFVVPTSTSNTKKDGAKQEAATGKK